MVTSTLCRRNDGMGGSPTSSVDATLRGAGVGRALLEAAEAHLRGSGVRIVRLAFLAGNATAERVYRQSGYEPYEMVFEKRW